MIDCIVLMSWLYCIDVSLYLTDMSIWWLYDALYDTCEGWKMAMLIKIQVCLTLCNIIILRGCTIKLPAKKKKWAPVKRCIVGSSPKWRSLLSSPVLNPKLKKHSDLIQNQNISTFTPNTLIAKATRRRKHIKLGPINPLISKDICALNPMNHQKATTPFCRPTKPNWVISTKSKGWQERERLEWSTWLWKGAQETR